jgi:hypothetical protein
MIINRNILVIFLSIFLFSVYAEGIHIPNDGYSNEIILQGKILLKEYFGPPNYGEDPFSDSIEKYFFIILDIPIIINLNGVEKSVTEIQLLYDINEHHIVNESSYKIKGKLFKAYTGHHHSDILILVSEIEVSEAQGCLGNASAPDTVFAMSATPAYPSALPITPATGPQGAHRYLVATRKLMKGGF